MAIKGRYAKGATFERQVVDYLREKGFKANRTAGSHGVIDVMAVRSRLVLFIQCKTNGALPIKEWNELFLDAWVCNGYGFPVLPILACRGEEGIEFYELMGKREPGSRVKEIERIEL